jgi:hypothetical protein
MTVGLAELLCVLAIGRVYLPYHMRVKTGKVRK